ncbi:MAG: DUF2927 domain-containing protein [Clostridia bacterium]|nr:DUF2927 domain-containing protein [Clostridia bacterium]
MKKASLIFIFICLLLLCACGKDESSLTTTRSQPSYAFQTTPAATLPSVPPTTQLNVGNTVGTQIFYTSTNIWSDFDDVQRYDNTPVDTTVTPADVTVFNYPLQTVLAYFSEIAFADEGEGAIGAARKWIKPIYYEIYGTADEVDVAVIRWASEYLNGIKGFPGMFAATATNKANVKFYFGNMAFVQNALGITDNTVQSCTRIFYNSDDYRIQLAKVGVITDTTSRETRNSLILEEVLQMLGLNQNSLNYPQSLFYKANALPQVPDELDLSVVRLLYSPVIKSGMNKADGVTAAADVLKTRYESGVVYTEPKVDFTMLALEYAITTVTDAPTEEPTTEPNNDNNNDPTDPPPTDPPVTNPPATDPPETETATRPIVTIPYPSNTTEPPTQKPTEPIVTNPPVTNPPDSDDPTGPTVPEIDI